eukprot:3304048-Pyramimonas_sp.AAC.1
MDGGMPAPRTPSPPSAMIERRPTDVGGDVDAGDKGQDDARVLGGEDEDVSEISQAMKMLVVRNEVLIC